MSELFKLERKGSISRDVSCVTDIDLSALENKMQLQSVVAMSNLSSSLMFVLTYQAGNATDRINWTNKMLSAGYIKQAEGTYTNEQIAKVQPKHEKSLLVNVIATNGAANCYTAAYKTISKEILDTELSTGISSQMSSYVDKTDKNISSLNYDVTTISSLESIISGKLDLLSSEFISCCTSSKASISALHDMLACTESKTNSHTTKISMLSIEFLHYCLTTNTSIELLSNDTEYLKAKLFDFIAETQYSIYQLSCNINMTQLSVYEVSEKIEHDIEPKLGIVTDLTEPLYNIHFQPTRTFVFTNAMLEKLSVLACS